MVLLALAVVGIIAIATAAVVGDSGNSRATGDGGATNTSPNASPDTFPPSSGESASASASISTSTDPARSAATVAAVLDRQLARSMQARSGVQPALNQIAACEADETDLAVLRRAAAVRRELVTGLRGMDLSALPNAETLRTRLTALWLYSATADDFYVRWGVNQAGCFGAADGDEAKVTGDRYSVRATAAKKSFLSLWNPIAARYGLAQRDPAQI